MALLIVVKLISLVSNIRGNKTVLALMKVGKRWNYVKEVLKKEHIIQQCLIALNVGMPDQVIQNASKYNSDIMPYFSLILIRLN